MSDSPCEVPLTEQLSSIPADYRTVRAIQWTEDGRETGHQFIPVGYMMHRAANRILVLERQLSEALEREKALRQELAIERENGERLRFAAAHAVRSAQDGKQTDFCHAMSTGRGLAIALNSLRDAVSAYESGDEPTYTDCPIHGRNEGDCPRC